MEKSSKEDTHVAFLLYYSDLIRTREANATTNNDNPISSHSGFVFRDVRPPSRAPKIEPVITRIAGNGGTSPRDQNTSAPAVAVKMVVKSDVAIAFLTSSPIILKKGGNRLPPLPPLSIVRKFRIKAPPVTIPAFGLIFSESSGKILLKWIPITVITEIQTNIIDRVNDAMLPIKRAPVIVPAIPPPMTGMAIFILRFFL